MMETPGLLGFGFQAGEGLIESVAEVVDASGVVGAVAAAAARRITGSMALG